MNERMEQRHRVFIDAGPSSIRLINTGSRQEKNGLQHSSSEIKEELSCYVLPEGHLQHPRRWVIHFGNRVGPKVAACYAGIRSRHPLDN